MMNSVGKRPLWLDILLLVLIPIIGLAIGVGVTIMLNINQAAYGNLIVNLFFLGACLGAFRLFPFSRPDLGLQPIQSKVKWHVSLSFIVLLLYMIFYLVVIRISGLRPFSAAMIWGLLTNLVVVVAEELFFRGMLFGFLQKRFSARTALIVSSLLFGLFHARQGLRGVVLRSFTGWLWGSVRYATGMIFLIIFPIHYAFNTTWLLFVGNWSNPPVWAIYTLPIIEFVLGLAFVMIRDRQSERIEK